MVRLPVPNRSLRRMDRLSYRNVAKGQSHVPIRRYGWSPSRNRSSIFWANQRNSSRPDAIPDLWRVNEEAIRLYQLYLCRLHLLAPIPPVAGRLPPHAGIKGPSRNRKLPRGLTPRLEYVPLCSLRLLLFSAINTNRVSATGIDDPSQKENRVGSVIANRKHER